MQQSRADAKPYSSIPGVDPEIDWAFGPGREFSVLRDAGELWLPVLLELEGIGLDAFARMFDEKAEGDTIRIPPVYENPPSGLAAATFCAALVTAKFFDRLRDKSDPLRGHIAHVSLGPPMRPEKQGY